MPVPFEHPHDPSIGTFELKNLQELCNTIRSKDIDCEFRMEAGGIRAIYDEHHLAEAKAAIDYMKQHIPAMADDIHFVTNKAELARYHIPTALGAVISQPAAKFWPYKFVAAILAGLLNNTNLFGTFNLQTFTPVTSLARAPSAVTSAPLTQDTPDTYAVTPANGSYNQPPLFSQTVDQLLRYQISTRDILAKQEQDFINSAGFGECASSNPALQEARTELMLLERSNKKRLLMARMEEEEMFLPAHLAHLATVEKGNHTGPRAMQAWLGKMAVLEQRNNDLGLMVRQAQGEVIPPSNHAPYGIKEAMTPTGTSVSDTTSGNAEHALLDYRMQLNLVQQQNRKRDQLAQQLQKDFPASTARHALQDYDMQMMILEQQNRKRELMRQNEENDKACASSRQAHAVGIDQQDRSGKHVLATYEEAVARVEESNKKLLFMATEWIEQNPVAHREQLRAQERQNNEQLREARQQKANAPSSSTSDEQLHHNDAADFSDMDKYVLQDYEMQLMLLDGDNEKPRQQEANAPLNFTDDKQTHHHDASVADPSSMDNYVLQDYQMQLTLLDEDNDKQAHYNDTSVADPRSMDNYVLQDCQMQLTLLDGDNEKRRLNQQELSEQEIRARHEHVVALEQQTTQRSEVASQQDRACAPSGAAHETQRQFHNAAVVDQSGNGNQKLQDYHEQLALLEQQSKKRLLMARQEQPALGPWIITTPRGTIRAKKVVLATNGYTSHLLPSFADLIVPVRGQMSALVPPCSLQDESILSTSFGFLGAGMDDYLIQRENPTGEPHGAHFMFGGGRQHDKTSVGNSDDSVINEDVAKYLRTRLPEALFCDDSEVNQAPTDPSGQPTELTATHEWTGIMGFSRDNLPWVGAVPSSTLDPALMPSVGNPNPNTSTSHPPSNLYISAGYTGHGMPNAWLSGKHLALLITRDHLHPHLASTPSKPTPAFRWGEGDWSWYRTISHHVPEDDTRHHTVLSNGVFTRVHGVDTEVEIEERVPKDRRRDVECLERELAMVELPEAYAVTEERMARARGVMSVEEVDRREQASGRRMGV